MGIKSASTKFMGNPSAPGSFCEGCAPRRGAFLTPPPTPSYHSDQIILITGLEYFTAIQSCLTRISEVVWCERETERNGFGQGVCIYRLSASELCLQGTHWCAIIQLRLKFYIHAVQVTKSTLSAFTSQVQFKTPFCNILSIAKLSLSP